MKVTSVNPGVVTTDITGSYGFTYWVNGLTCFSTQRFDTAAAAKQAMREKVAQERKRHLI